MAYTIPGNYRYCKTPQSQLALSGNGPCPMKYYLLKYIWLAPLLAWWSARGQYWHDQLIHRAYTVEQGLSSNQLYFAHQDSRGDLWLASDHGIMKFDGKRFSFYTQEDGLAGNTVFKIIEDDQKRLWFLTYQNGICYWEKGKFHTPPFNERMLQLIAPDDHIQQIAFAEGQIYLSTRYGNSFYLQASLDGTLAKVDLSAARSRVQSDATVMVWSLELGPGNHLSGIYHNQVEPEKLVTDRFMAARSQCQGKEVWFYSLNEYRDNRCFFKNNASGGPKIVTQHTQALIIEGDSFYTYDFPSPVLDLVIWDRHYYFLLQNGGMMHFQDRIDKEHLQGHYLQSYAPTSLLKDKSGSYWATTLHNGLLNIRSFRHNSYVIPARNPGFIISSPIYLRGNSLRYLEKDSLVEAHIKNGIIEPLRKIHLVNALEYPMRTQKVAWLPDGSVFSNFQKFRIENSSSSVRGEPWVDKIRRPYLNALKYLPDSQAVLGLSKSGFFTIDSTGIKFDSELRGLRENITCMLPMQDGRFLIGSNNQLLTYQPADSSISYFENPRLHHPVTAMANDRYGRFWVLVKGQGLALLDGDSIYFLDKYSGLSSNWCLSILLDSNRAWVGTHNGLNHLSFDRQSVRVEYFTGFNHGLSSDFIDNILDNGETMAILSGKKFTLLDKWEMEKPHPQKPLLEAIEVADSTYAYYNLNTLELKPGDNNITFHYRLNSLIGDPKIWYRYRLAGWDDAWTYSHETSVTYLDLEPGTYHFEVTARNARGQWALTPLTYTFTVPSHIYERAWFQVLCGLLIIGLLAFLFQRYRLRQQKKLYVQNQLTRSGIRALKAQMNPHFMFNALNSVRHLVLSGQQTEADRYLLRFSKLLRGLLHDMEQSKVSLASEIKLIQNYLVLEEMRLQNTIQWKIQLPDELRPEELWMPSMLLQPIIENSLWHGFRNINYQGELNITFALQQNVLRCTITDNGVGLKPATTPRENEGVGLQNVKERLSLFSQYDKKPYSMNIASGPGQKGTVVHILIPQ